jgi:zinc transporter ZupT
MTDAKDKSAPRASLPRIVFAGLAPLLLVLAMTWWFLSSGASWLRLGKAPIEKLAIERVVFRPQEIILKVRNVGPGPISIAQVLVNKAMWDFSITPGRDLPRLGTATISLFYDWQEGEPYTFSIVSGNGIPHTRTVEIAMPTPSANPRSFAVFGLLGAYVGLIPVFLGLLWLPFLRAMPRAWMDFWISLTMGLLVFLGIDTLKESFEILGRVPEFLNGALIVAAGAIGSFLALTGVGLRKRGDSGGRKEAASGMGLATLIAIGIGLHNLGEGLAIGAAYTLGEVALGSFLIVGFTLHNTTEGLAILSPLVSGKARLRDLAWLGVLGGGPTIVGAWIGAFTYSDPLSLLFLGVGAGAIFQVVLVLARSRTERDEPIVEALARPRNAAGLIAGFALMYATSLLVAG